MSSSAYEALKSSLLSKSDPSSTAREFTEPVMLAYSKGEDIEGQLEIAWKSLIDLSSDIPHESQGSLVEVVKAVQRKSISTDDNDKPCKIWGEEVKLWEDLPLFGPCLREAWNRGMQPSCRACGVFLEFTSDKEYSTRHRL